MTALSSTALAALEKLCEAATIEPTDQRAYVFTSSDLAFAAQARRAFPSLAATIRASEARIGELEQVAVHAFGAAKLLAEEAAQLEAQRDAALTEVEQLKGEAAIAQDVIARMHHPTIEDVFSRARPSAPAPDRGVPGQDSATLDSWLCDIIEMARDQKSECEWELTVAEVLGNARVGMPDFARATHPAPPEWRDAIEAAAKLCTDVAQGWSEQNSRCVEDALQYAARTDQANELAAAIRALPPPSTSASPWRDIASGPKTGQHLFYGEVCDELTVTEGFVLDDGNIRAAAFNGNTPLVLCPTHWMPLPAPPSTLATEGEDGR